MKVSPPSPPVAPEPRGDECADGYAKRRRLESQTADQTGANGHGHHRHRRHVYPQQPGEDACPPPAADAAGNGHEDPSGRNEPAARGGPPGAMSSPPLHSAGHDGIIKDGYQQTTVINNNNCNNEEDYMTLSIINAAQHLVTNNDSKTTISLSTHTEKNSDNEINKATNNFTMPSSIVEHPIRNVTENEKNPTVMDTNYDDSTTGVIDECINNDICNEECLSQSPLNLTRSQGSSVECGNKSEDDDEGEYDDGCEENNGFGSAANGDENAVDGHNLLPAEAPFPWNAAAANNNKQKQQHQDDKIAAPPPQLLLTSGQLTTGCLQAAQLLIPTARGIMTQMILAIPLNDMVSSAITASTSNQQQLLQHTSNNVRQKNVNRQQFNQSCQPSMSLPVNRYFQHQPTADDTTDNVNNDNNSYDSNLINNGSVSTDQYNNIQRRKWQSPDLASKKHNFLSPQQKPLIRTKNGEVGETMNTQHSKESSMIQTPAGTIGDCHIYPANNVPSTVSTAMPMSPPALRRNGSNNGGADVIHRQTVWPTAVTTTDQLNGGDENDNEDKQQPQHQSTRGITPAPIASSTNINTLKTLAPPSSQLNCHVKQSKEDDPTSAAAAAAAAYNQQNAICTALATHMLCASQLAAAQQPMYDNMDNGNAVKKPIHTYNNNNNNIKTNNMMGVVNPAALEKWMMEERYYYNNNNNNSKNIAGGHAHHQRYNAAAAAAAAAAAVELLGGGGGGGGGISGSSSGGGGGDSLASCKKRKRRTSFTPHALELLNGHFERNTHPSGSEITGLAHRLGYEREVIRIWFCNKRQALKNTVRTINGSGPPHMTSSKLHNNTSGY